MSDYPAYLGVIPTSWVPRILDAGLTLEHDLFCKAPGCSYVPDSTKRIIKAMQPGAGDGPTPRFSREGTDLCNWHHAQLPRVLTDLAELHPLLEAAAYTKTSRGEEAGVRGNTRDGAGHPADVGTSWNPHAAVVLAELNDWTRYLVRTVLRERPLQDPEIRTHIRKITTYTLEGDREVEEVPVEYVHVFTHGLALDDSVPAQLVALARWHAAWLSGYPDLGPAWLADAVQHRRLGLKAMDTAAVTRMTLKNVVCGYQYDDTDFGEVVCGAALFAIIRPRDDGRPSEILCSSNPRHPQLSREAWIDAMPRTKR